MMGYTWCVKKKKVGERCKRLRLCTWAVNRMKRAVRAGSEEKSWCFGLCGLAWLFTRDVSGITEFEVHRRGAERREKLESVT